MISDLMKDYNRFNRAMELFTKKYNTIQTMGLFVKDHALYLEKEHNYPPQQIDSIMNKYVDVYISALGVDPKVKAETTKEFKVFSAATIVMLENCKSFN